MGLVILAAMVVAGVAAAVFACCANAGDIDREEERKHVQNDRA